MVEVTAAGVTAAGVTAAAVTAAAVTELMRVAAGRVRIKARRTPTPIEGMPATGAQASITQMGTATAITTRM